MHKCEYKEDCRNYPHCGHTCGIPIEQLFKEAVAREWEAKLDLAEILCIMQENIAHMRRKESILQETKDMHFTYRPTCPLGYCDCVSDPAYIRWAHPKQWKELDMPTECSCAKKARETGECNYYDDEDK